MSELDDSLARLEAALRAIGERDRAAWVAERVARAGVDPDGVRADVRGVLAGMGSIADLPLDRDLVDRVRRAVGDEPDADPHAGLIPVQPGGPLGP